MTFSLGSGWLSSGYFLYSFTRQDEKLPVHAKRIILSVVLGVISLFTYWLGKESYHKSGEKLSNNILLINVEEIIAIEK